MELEDTKLKNRTLKTENNELRKRIAHVAVSDHENERDENIQNHLKIIEEIISERNDLKELLDKFLSISDQIVELKVQADQMKIIENEYKSLQDKLRDQQTELEKVRNENKTSEERILELQSSNEGTESLKVCNFNLNFF